MKKSVFLLMIILFLALSGAVSAGGKKETPRTDTANQQPPANRLCENSGGGSVLGETFCGHGRVKAVMKRLHHCNTYCTIEIP